MSSVTGVAGGNRRVLPLTVREDKPQKQQDNEPGQRGATEPQDSLRPSTDNERKSYRPVRRAFLEVASTGVGVLNAVSGLPEGVQIAKDTMAGASTDAKVTKVGRWGVLASVTTGSAVGMAIGGPVGLVCGAALGFLGGTLNQHLAERSGAVEHRVNSVSGQVQKAIGEEPGAWGRVKGLVTGAAAGVKEGFQQGKRTSKIQLAGALDGVEEVMKGAHKASDDNPVSKPELPELGRLGKILAKTTGLLCGISGVMINAPGGLVIGMLEPLKEDQNRLPDGLTKTSLLIATNVGKVVPGAMVAGALGGPVGAAAGAAVGLVTASLTSIIDGRFGVNRRIARPVEKSVEKSHSGEISKNNLRNYYRSGKGAVVGLAAGVREGWNAGYQGGIDMVNGVLSVSESKASKTES